MDRARAISLSLHDLFKERRKNHAAIARQLWDMKRDGLHLYLGYSSLASYAFAEHQVGKSQACELAGIAEACERLPKLREAFYGGEIDWTKAREVSKVATPETETDWLDRAEVLEDGWQRGHDPERMLTLCWWHHRARHLGLLRIEGSAPEFEFVLLDGEVLERERDAFSYENSRLDSVSGGQERVGGTGKAVRDATLALRRLGVRAREAGDRVQAALTNGSSESWTAGELVRTVLKAS